MDYLTAEMERGKARRRRIVVLSGVMDGGEKVE